MCKHILTVNEQLNHMIGNCTVILQMVHDVMNAQPRREVFCDHSVSDNVARQVQDLRPVPRAMLLCFGCNNVEPENYNPQKSGL